ncbi:MAG: DinB family protein [Acidobacteria bacterium]|nr:DinB family protein [Acidobacteriota bacterium]
MSATASIFPATLEQRIDEITKIREALIKEASLDGDIEPSNGWSISEILFHLHVVEKSFLKIMDVLLNSPKVENKSDEYLRTEWQFIGQFVSNRDTKIEAPDMVKPINAPSLEESIHLLSESRASLLQYLKTITLDQLRCVEMEHPVKHLGLTISGPGWVSFLGHHELRHLEQIKELKQTSK